ncbi:hypothetical protein HL666_04075 [Bradyrhizobium sp. 83002]|uniref:hypothetical protein n=1 Tax=Bradyrhizobium aeschynomenes TaxID=2734909 RepID=UPI001554981E|nr:hypothetical protein [Bradyrhizobium aeschynomenes]NPU09930.1 hypothetical protein [Bradyrhizobium aeschynomenes]NPV23508.1 hypothetical protein [Bradyrhizobium aeschynomenes]
MTGTNEMRFYILGSGESSGEGVDLDDVETVLLQTADTALAIARDRLEPSTTNVSLEVRSDGGRIGQVTVSVLIERG